MNEFFCLFLISICSLPLVFKWNYILSNLPFILHAPSAPALRTGPGAYRRVLSRRPAGQHLPLLHPVPRLILRGVSRRSAAPLTGSVEGPAEQPATVRPRPRVASFEFRLCGFVSAAAETLNSSAVN